MESMREYMIKLKAGMELYTTTEIEIDFISQGHYINVVQPNIARLQEKIDHA